MIKQTSSIEHYKAFLRPVMNQDQVIRLLENIWAAGVAYGTRMTDQAHEILDEPEFRLTEWLRFPIENMPKAGTIHPGLRSAFYHHVAKANEIIRKNNSIRFKPGV